MSINCDVCNADVTPGNDDDHREILRINGKKICCCIDCWVAISDWVQSDEAKKFCKAHTKNLNDEMGD